MTEFRSDSFVLFSPALLDVDVRLISLLELDEFKKFVSGRPELGTLQYPLYDFPVPFGFHRYGLHLLNQVLECIGLRLSLMAILYSVSPF